MRRIMIFLVLLLMFPFSVKADNNDVKIARVELLEKTESTEIVEEPKVNLNKVDFNLKFSEVGDKATYQIVIKNESNKSFEISNETKYSDDDYIKYEFSFDDNNILKAGEEKSMYVIISYNKEVPATSYVDGKYTVNKSVVVDIVNDTITVLVPNTISNSILRNVAIATIIIVIIALVILVKGKSKVSVIILCLLLIPFSVYALQKISLEINAKVEIEEDSIPRVYAINENTITKDTSTLEDIGQTYSSCANTEKNVCLRYTLENDIVKESEVCFIRGAKEYCLNGSDRFTNNVEKLLTIFTETDACFGYEDGRFDCHASDINAKVISNGNVDAAEGEWHCDIVNNRASCANGWPTV